MTRCGWIIGALLLTSQSAAAQWRMKTESGGLRGPVHYLTVASRERNADLEVTCYRGYGGKDELLVAMDLRAPGIFNFHSNYNVFLDARFLPSRSGGCGRSCTPCRPQRVETGPSPHGCRA